MALAPGVDLGSYEIIDLLGAGGMGEVYRARDNGLGREVAIKVRRKRSPCIRSSQLPIPNSQENLRECSESRIS